MHVDGPQHPIIVHNMNSKSPIPDSDDKAGYAIIMSLMQYAFVSTY
jgi:hypothetical protein